MHNMNFFTHMFPFAPQFLDFDFSNIIPMLNTIVFKCG